MCNGKKKKYGENITGKVRLLISIICSCRTFHRNYYLKISNKFGLHCNFQYVLKMVFISKVFLQSNYFFENYYRKWVELSWLKTSHYLRIYGKWYVRKKAPFLCTQSSLTESFLDVEQLIKLMLDTMMCSFHKTQNSTYP